MIEVKAKTIEQFVDEVLISSVEYCARARSILPELVHDVKGRQRNINGLIIIGAHLEVLTKKFNRAFKSHDYYLIS